MYDISFAFEKDVVRRDYAARRSLCTFHHPQHLSRFVCILYAARYMRRAPILKSLVCESLPKNRNINSVCEITTLKSFLPVILAFLPLETLQSSLTLCKVVPHVCESLIVLFFYFCWVTCCRRLGVTFLNYLALLIFSAVVEYSSRFQARKINCMYRIIYLTARTSSSPHNDI